MPFSVNRPLLAQQFRTFPFVVGAAPLPIQPNVNLNDLIDSFAITVPLTAANSIFLGNAGVAVGTGLELLPGTTSQLVIDHDGRQLYELQAPTLDMDSVARCKSVQAEAIPFVVWDLANVFVIAAAPTAVTIAVFRAMYI